MSSENSDKDVTDDQYELFLSVIAHNTGGKSPVMVPKPNIKVIYCRKYSAETCDEAANKALRQGHALATIGKKNTPLFGLTLDGLDQIAATHPYSQTDIEHIREIVTAETEKENPNEEIIGWGNTHIMNLKEE